VIRENVNGSSSQKEPEDFCDGDPGLQYNMGQSQKYPVHIPTFLQQNEGDPAVKVHSFIHIPLIVPHTLAAALFLEVEEAPPSLYSSSTPPGSCFTPRAPCTPCTHQFGIICWRQWKCM
jgi:hypothetical protein